MKLVVTILLMLVVGLTNPALVCADLVNVGFESPDYAVGDVVGQQGWVAAASNNGGEALVDATRAFSGSQSLRIDTATLGGPSWWYQPFALEAAGRVVDVRFDLYLPSNGTDQYSAFGVDLYGSGPSILRVWTEYDDLDGVTYINTTEGLTFQEVSRDQWHQFAMSLDYQTEEYTLWLDGNFVETGTLDTGLAGTTLTDVDIWATAPSGVGDQAWFDGLVVSAVPEPSSAWVVVCLMCSLLLSSRPNRDAVLADL